MTSGPSIAAVAAALGIDPTDARPVRSASRSVVVFPRAGVRTFAAPGDPPTAEVAAGRLLAGLEVPATRPCAGPVAVDGWWVTGWREIDGVRADEAVDAGTLGGLARRLHDATAGGPDAVTDGPGASTDGPVVGPADPLAAAAAQLDLARRAGATPEADLDVMATRADAMAVRWADAVAAAREAAGLVVVHGDLHPENVVVGAAGPALVDLELAGWGPATYDAAPTAALVRWYGAGPAALDAFDAGYGAPLTEAASAAGLDEVWVQWSTSWALANRHRSPAADDEARVRVETLRTGVAPRPWHLR